MDAGETVADCVIAVFGEITFGGKAQDLAVDAVVIAAAHGELRGREIQRLARLGAVADRVIGELGDEAFAVGSLDQAVEPIVGEASGLVLRIARRRRTDGGIERQRERLGEQGLARDVAVRVIGEARGEALVVHRQRDLVVGVVVRGAREAARVDDLDAIAVAVVAVLHDVAERIGDARHAIVRVVGVGRGIAARIGNDRAVVVGVVLVGGGVAERIDLGGELTFRVTWQEQFVAEGVYILTLQAGDL